VSSLFLIADPLLDAASNNSLSNFSCILLSVLFLEASINQRIAYRKAMKRAMQSTLRLGAKGIKITVAGRLAGTEIARTEWLREGSIPLHTLRADVDYGEAEAETTYGIIGVKVWIYKGIVFEKDKKKIDDAEIKNINEKENVTAS